MTQEIQQNLKTVLQDIPSGVTLVAVSKTKPVELLQQAYEAGQRDFGENKAQEMAVKYQELPHDICWHFIGHLQTNKVKYIAPFVSLIHAVDSLKVLHEINKQAIINDRAIDCLLEFHIAEEESKFGLSRETASEILSSVEFKEMKNVRICGVMGMATYTSDEEKIRKEFRSLKEHFDFLKKGFFLNNSDFKEVSMGMSGDYLYAIEEGSTIVRVGSKIFGLRG
ncbi:MAG: YggS family pyridoxal phosphate-dependent enzyme [Bacteroidales bacterium]|nr:YggS family pyridoxal phosphate-dependent enzyme [Bacteroidales bacterium]